MLRTKPSANYNAIETENGNFLVKTPEGLVCYTDLEGNYLSGVDNPDQEWEWAKDEWDAEIEAPSPKFIENLETHLRYLV